MRPLSLVSLVLLVGCGRTIFFSRVEPCVFDSDCPSGLRCVNQECRVLDEVDAGPLRGSKRFGEPCDGGAECASAFCAPGPQGPFCTEACGAVDAGCPTAFTCKTMPDPDRPDAGRAIALCAVPQPLLCQDCQRDRDCGASGADRCVAFEGARFCARDCSFEGCPALYRCATQADGAKQCVPDGRTCDCTPATVGLEKGCRGAPTAFGRCQGNQRCLADGGFTACDAPPALEETCNGVDDDCNGRVDDFSPPECTRMVGARVCRGPQVCLATSGLVCTAQPPENEACNGRDDDCDGTVDNGFIDARGRYPQLAHCGRCNNDCAKIPNATVTTCDAMAAVVRCRVVACSAGFFPSADQTFCQALPDTLCRACQVDADCVGPNARCLTVDGQRVCGRDCSATSLSGVTCPTGYSCQAVTQQCVPSSGSCTCSARTVGTSRSCSVMEPMGPGLCRGFETCRAPGPAWSSCDVASFNPEICDARDNNCDGRVDEGFRNQASGRYEATEHCGFCNNDCTKLWSPVLDKTTGVCDLSQPLPRCMMGPCLTETQGGVTFEWVNVNADTSDGCECRRRQGNLTVDLPDRVVSSAGAASWVDENCDGVDGVVGDAIFVSATGAAVGNGTRTAPFRTIAEGLAALGPQNKRYVLVAQGLYRENVRLSDGQQLFGGYSSDFFKRDPRVHTAFIQGVQPTALTPAAVSVQGAGFGAAETIVAGFTIVGWDAPAAPVNAAGEASIGVSLVDVGPRVVVATNDIIAGRGGQGGNGSTGAQGFGRQGSMALNGARGQDSTHFAFGDCVPGTERVGGLGGQNPQCPAGNAPPGGLVVCPSYSMTTNLGQQQQYQGPANGSRNGRGGFDRTFSFLSGGGCSQVQESGYPSTIQPNDGEDGVQGPDGTGGLGGAGAPVGSRFGSVSAGRWVSSSAGAVAGVGGAVGLFGGGGGAGSGVTKFAGGGCQAWEMGASGGGGGAGACGGAGGLPGAQGGASIALFIASTSFTSARPNVLNNRLQRGPGGNGGNGGFGGAGGVGGIGGLGGEPDRWSSSTGGKGGEGGNGGPGGGGGGGSGGPSFAVLAYNLDPVVSATNTFLVNAAIDTAGRGGVGGSSPGAATSTGGPGARGAFGEVVTLRACSAGCQPGTTCDANQVCVPN